MGGFFCAQYSCQRNQKQNPDTRKELVFGVKGNLKESPTRITDKRLTLNPLCV